MYEFGLTINQRMFSCKRCGKFVNERFRYEYKKDKDVWYEHPYCAMVRR